MLKAIGNNWKTTIQFCNKRNHNVRLEDYNNALCNSNVPFITENFVKISATNIKKKRRKKYIIKEI